MGFPISPIRLANALTSAALLLGALLLTLQLIPALQQLQRLQADRAELHDVKYGLFNAAIWVEHAATIVANRVDDFELTQANRPALKRKLERVLDRLFVEVDQYLRRRNTGGEDLLSILQGGLRQGVQDWLLDVDELRARVPFYADAIIDELDRPESRSEIKATLIALLRDAAAASFSDLDRTRYDQVLARYGCPDAGTCSQQLDASVITLRAGTQRTTLLVLALVALLFLLNALWPRLARLRPPTATALPALPPEVMAMLTIATLVLLASGVLAPMIEVDARIAELRFALLGEPVVFTDQVLYFQSKSIIDVVRVLTDTGKPDMLLVALLITLFSLVFPAAKTVAGYLYYTNLRGLRGRGLRGQPLVDFFALRSGKWSMADVLVVAMLMAYVGFKGLVGSQLASIAGSGHSLEVVTTDGTSLQAGFFMFLAFVFASMLLSALLEARVDRSTS